MKARRSAGLEQPRATWVNAVNSRSKIWAMDRPVEELDTAQATLSAVEAHFEDIDGDEPVNRLYIDGNLDSAVDQVVTRQ